MSNKILARAFVKLALLEDKQIAINAAESAQLCCDKNCMKELTPAEAEELKVWLDIKSKEHSMQVEVQS